MMTEQNASSIHKIVITGGPCAGKTTAMSWIQNKLSQLGYTVLFLPEAATELKNGGLDPSICYPFEKCLIHLQLDREKAYEEYASKIPEGKVLLVCDRGVMDATAYLSSKENARIYWEFGSSETEFRDHYDAVFHLVTTAKGAEDAYTLENNKARSETMEEARALDDRLIQAWTGHPHFRVIDNSTDFPGKMKRLLEEITSFLGEPQPYEIERKFLIKKPSKELLDSFPCIKKIDIIQTYLISPPGEELRIRQRGSNGSYAYYQTRKREVQGCKRLETERRLTEQEYLQLLMQADPGMHPVRKERYCLTHQNRYFEIDLYPQWENEAILEIELKDENEEMQIPDGIEVIREVTDDPHYRNAYLARNNAGITT